MTVDSLFAVISVSLFLVACALFIGGKLVALSPDVRRTGVRLNLVPQTSFLLVAAVGAGLVPMLKSPTPPLEPAALPSPAAGLPGLIEPAERRSTDGDGMRREALAHAGAAAGLGLPPQAGRYTLIRADTGAQADVGGGTLELLAESLNRYHVVLEVVPGGEGAAPGLPGAARHLATGALERRDGLWWLTPDFSRLPGGLLPAGVPARVGLDGHQLVVFLEPGDSPVNLVWQVNGIADQRD